MLKPIASIILPCKNEGENIRLTVSSILQARGRLPYEVTVIDDGSADGCCNWLRDNPPPGVKLVATPGLGAAQARNLGAQHSKGDYLIFCDAHIFVGNYWLENLLAPLQKGICHGICPGIAPVEDPGNVGWGQTIKDDFGVLWMGPVKDVTPVPVLPGGCLAVTTPAFRHVGGFDEGFQVWGHEDVELSIHLWLYGYTLAVHPQVKVLHVFRPSHPYKVTMENFYFNLLRIAVSHFGQTRISKIIAMARQSHVFDDLMSSFLLSDIWEQRKRYLAERRYDDDWLMDKFGINF
ncbi:MAG: glycosyltransferase [Clostridia bacterium]|nr:glycosyltransferase [Clostridia bacterium]